MTPHAKWLMNTMQKIISSLTTFLHQKTQKQELDFFSSISIGEEWPEMRFQTSFSHFFIIMDFLLF